MSSSSKTRQKSKHIKVVVRGLPKALTENELKEQMGDIPKHVYYRFSRPNMNLDYLSFPILNVAFTTEEDVLTFSQRFHGFLFVDSDGNESPGIVELAASNEIPRHSRDQVGKDPEIAKAENSKEFLAFIKKMEEVVPKLTIEDQLRELIAKTTVSSTEITPLTKYMIQQQVERRNRLEERRRERLEARNARHEKLRGIKEDVRPTPAPKGGKEVTKDNKEGRLKTADDVFAKLEVGKKKVDKAVAEKPVKSKPDKAPVAQTGEEGRKMGRQLLDFAKGDKDRQAAIDEKREEEKRKRREKQQRERKEKAEKQKVLRAEKKDVDKPEKTTEKKPEAVERTNEKKAANGNGDALETLMRRLSSDTERKDTAEARPAKDSDKVRTFSRTNNAPRNAPSRREHKDVGADKKPKIEREIYRPGRLRKAKEQKPTTPGSTNAESSANTGGASAS